jgi:cytochrome P450
VGTALPDDLMARYICDRVDGRELSDLEVLGLGVTILNAGNETTINLINNLLWRLLEVPSRWEMLKADPFLIEAAMEESLHYDLPVLGMLRKAVKDTEMKGCPICEGELVMYYIAGANRDPAIWDDPDTIRLDRPVAWSRRHISFGGGNHMRLGVQLARMGAMQVFEKLTARLPNLRLTGKLERIEVFNFWGRLKFPVAW